MFVWLAPGIHRDKFTEAIDHTLNPDNGSFAEVTELHALTAPFPFGVITIVVRVPDRS